MPTRTALDKNRSDSISAALRHLRDAEHLALPKAHRSLDQAFHLAGFAPECARKACLFVRWADHAIGHRFDDVSEKILDTVLSLDAHAHRYHPTQWHARYPELGTWKVESRYWKTGTAVESNTMALLGAAREAVDSVVMLMWADGVLPAEALQ